MLLSVVLPFHLQNRFLEEAIRSCSKAMPKDSELILVNTSQQKLTLTGFSKRILVIDAPQKKYIDALSIGISQAKGNFIALMNSDDLILESRFERQMFNLNQDKADLNLPTYVF